MKEKERNRQIRPKWLKRNKEPKQKQSKVNNSKKQNITKIGKKTNFCFFSVRSTSLCPSCPACYGNSLRKVELCI
jgi:hypothetical protein